MTYLIKPEGERTMTTTHRCNQEQNMEPLLVSEREACRILRVSRSFLARDRMECDTGGTRVPFVKAGRKVLYAVADLHEWVRKNTHGNTP